MARTQECKVFRQKTLATMKAFLQARESKRSPTLRGVEQLFDAFARATSLDTGHFD